MARQIWWTPRFAMPRCSAGSWNVTAPTASTALFPKFGGASHRHTNRRNSDGSNSTNSVLLHIFARTGNRDITARVANDICNYCVTAVVVNVVLVGFLWKVARAATLRLSCGTRTRRSSAQNARIAPTTNTM